MAFVNEERRLLKATARTLKETRTPTFRAAGEDGFPRLSDPPLESGSDPQARNFQALLDDLEMAGADAYVHYRLLSRYSHAGVHIVEQYLVPDKTGENVEAVSIQPREKSDTLWLFYATASLVWAGTALDYIDPARSRRSQLRRAAANIGIPRDLHLTAEAQQRVNKAKQARRQARAQRDEG